MACAASTEPGDTPPVPFDDDPGAFDPEQRYGLHPQVALRPEPFGALAYHYGNRRLTFLRSDRLVTLVRALDAHGSVTEALSASSFPPERWPSVLTALAQLARSEVIRAA